MPDARARRTTAPSLRGTTRRRLVRTRVPPDELDRARDRALVEEALQGNLDAFNRLVELYQDCSSA